MVNAHASPGPQAGAQRARGDGVYLPVLLGLCSYSFILMVLGSLGLFRGPALILTAVAILAGLLMWLRRQTRAAGATTQEGRKAAGWELAPGLGLLVAVIALLYLPPGEFVLGGWDPGVYFNSGAALAQSGGFHPVDPLLRALGPTAREVLSAQEPALQPFLQPGFYWGDTPGQVVTQFPFLLTAWTAVGILMVGPAGGLHVPVLVSAFAAFFFYLLARRLLGPWGGLAAAVLLVVNAVQVWHGRMSFSEELLQAFFFGGIWAAVRWEEEGELSAAIAAGFALSLLPLIKVEGALLSAIAATALRWLPSSEVRTRPRDPFWAVYAAGILFAAVFWGTTARTALLDQLAHGWGFGILGALLLLGLGLGSKVGQPILSSIQRLLSEPGLKRSFNYSLLSVAMLGGLAFTSSEVRSAAHLSSLASLWQGLFLSPLDMLLLAAVPILLLRAQTQGPDVAFPVVIALLAAGSALYLAVFLRYYLGREDIPLFMWTTRRFVPTLLPLLALLEGWAVLRIAGLFPARQRLLVAAGLVLLVAGRWPELAPVAATREYGGALQAVAELAASTKAKGVLLLDGDAAGIRFAAPLTFLAHRDSYVLWSKAHGPGALIETAQAQGRPVYYLTSQPGAWPEGLERYQPERAGQFKVSLPELERISTGRPQKANTFYAHFMLFRLGSRGGPAPLELPLTIDVGSEHFSGYMLLREGFFAGEDAPQGVTFRWTTEQASIALPSELRPRQVALRMASGRPNAPGPVWATLSCGDEVEGVVPVAAEFAEYVFELGHACFDSQGGVLSLRTTPWSPAEAGSGADGRHLGLMLDWVRLQ